MIKLNAVTFVRAVYEEIMWITQHFHTATFKVTTGNRLENRNRLINVT